MAEEKVDIYPSLPSIFLQQRGRIEQGVASRELITDEEK